MNPQECCSPCPAPTPPVNVPGAVGNTGQAGINGINGIDAFSILSADFTTPLNTITPVNINVSSTLWMVIGETLIIGQGAGVAIVNPGPGTFKITAIPSPTQVTVTFMHLTGDVGFNTVISAGAVVSGVGQSTLSLPLAVANGGTGATTVSGALADLGLGSTPLTVYASGTKYTFTNSTQLLTFGTTSPSLTISAVGTYLLLARVRVDYTAATFAATQTVQLKLRRTNNVAADINNSVSSFQTDTPTTKTYTAQIVNLQQVVYVTSNNNDVIEIWGFVGATPGAGTLDAIEASIVAVKLFDQTL